MRSTAATCPTAIAPPTSPPPTGCWRRGSAALDVARELDRHGFTDVAEAVLGMQRQRVSADYLQTSAIIDPTGAVSAAVNDPNRYSGPGTGYRLDGERWQRLQQLPHELDARTSGRGRRTRSSPWWSRSTLPV